MIEQTTAEKKPRPAKARFLTTPSPTRFVRHGTVLDKFLLDNFLAYGYQSPNDWIVGLIRNAMHAHPKG